MVYKIKENIRTYVLYGVLTVCTGLMALGAYARIWEYKQPKQEIENVIVRSIEPYYHGGGDLHWSSSGKRIFIEGENRPIDFPSKRWDDTVREDDTVYLVVRRSFPWFGKNELDGLYIDDHE